MKKCMLVLTVLLLTGCANTAKDKLIRNCYTKLTDSTYVFDEDCYVEKEDFYPSDYGIWLSLAFNLEKNQYEIETDSLEEYGFYYVEYYITENDSYFNYLDEDGNHYDCSKSKGCSVSEKMAIKIITDTLEHYPMPNVY